MIAWTSWETMAQQMGNGNRLNNLEKTKMKSLENSALYQLKKLDGEGRTREETTLNKNKNNNKPPPAQRFYSLGTKMHNHIEMHEQLRPRGAERSYQHRGLGLWASAPRRLRSAFLPSAAPLPAQPGQNSPARALLTAVTPAGHRIHPWGRGEPPVPRPRFSLRPGKLHRAHGARTALRTAPPGQLSSWKSRAPERAELLREQSCWGNRAPDRAEHEPAEPQGPSCHPRTVPDHARCCVTVQHSRGGSKQGTSHDFGHDRKRRKMERNPACSRTVVAISCGNMN